MLTFCSLFSNTTLETFMPEQCVFIRRMLLRKPWVRLCVRHSGAVRAHAGRTSIGDDTPVRISHMLDCVQRRRGAMKSILLYFAKQLAISAQLLFSVACSQCILAQGSCNARAAFSFTVTCDWCGERNKRCVQSSSCVKVRARVAKRTPEL